MVFHEMSSPLIYCIISTVIINNVQLSKWEYFTASVGFNLPADVALYKKFTCDADGKPDCEFQDCELADTSKYSLVKAIIEEY